VSWRTPTQPLEIVGVRGLTPTYAFVEIEIEIGIGIEIEKPFTNCKAGAQTLEG